MRKNMYARVHVRCPPHARRDFLQQTPEGVRKLARRGSCVPPVATQRL